MVNVKLTSTIKKAIAEALAEYSERTGEKQQQIAKRCGVAQTTISNLQNPNSATTPLVTTVYRVIDGLGLTIPGVNATFEANTRMIPVVSSVQAGHFSEATDPFPVGGGEFDIPYLMPYPAGPRTFGLRIHGDSMLDEYQAGDIVIIDPDVEPTSREPVVAKLDENGDVTFKLYVPKGRDEDGNPIIELHPINPHFPLLVINAQHPGRIIGTMIGRLQGRRRH